MERGKRRRRINNPHGFSSPRPALKPTIKGELMQTIQLDADPARRTVYEAAMLQRMLDVAREANFIVRQTNLTHSEALKLAESTVPPVV